MSCALGWILPNTNFLKDFAMANDRISITMYLPELSSKWRKWHQKYVAA